MAINIGDTNWDIEKLKMSDKKLSVSNWKSKKKIKILFLSDLQVDSAKDSTICKKNKKRVV